MHPDLRACSLQLMATIARWRRWRRPAPRVTGGRERRGCGYRREHRQGLGFLHVRAPSWRSVTVRIRSLGRLGRNGWHRFVGAGAGLRRVGERVDPAARVGELVEAHGLAVARTSRRARTGRRAACPCPWRGRCSARSRPRGRRRRASPSGVASKFSHHCSSSGSKTVRPAPPGGRRRRRRAPGPGPGARRWRRPSWPSLRRGRRAKRPRTNCGPRRGFRSARTSTRILRFSAPAINCHDAGFSWCPPNCWRMAESSLSAKSASPRELKRSYSAAASTCAGTPSSTAASAVQRPSPESETRPEKLAQLGILLEGRGRQVEQPRADHAAAAPDLGDLGHVEAVLVVLGIAQGRRLGVLGVLPQADVGLLEDRQALGVGAHDPVLDAVVHHLHEVPGAVAAAVQIAVLGRRRRARARPACAAQPRRPARASGRSARGARRPASRRRS